MACVQRTLALGILFLAFISDAGASLTNPLCPLLLEEARFLVKGTEKKIAIQRGAFFAKGRGGQTYLIDVEKYPHSSGEFYSQVIRIRTGGDKSRRSEISEETLLQWISPNLEFTEMEYERRRDWPREFREKLGKMAEKHLGSSSYFSVFDANTHEIVGSLRTIRLREGKLPVEEYLGIEFDSVGVEEKVEIGTFAIKPTLEAKRSQIWLELWLQLMKESFGKSQSETAFLSQRFYTYADQVSERIYLPLGFQYVREYWKGGKEWRTPLMEEPPIFKKDGVNWRPIEFRPIQMRHRHQHLESRNRAGEANERLQELDNGEVGNALAHLFPMKDLLLELENAQGQSLETVRAMIARNASLMKTANEYYDREYRKLEAHPQYVRGFSELFRMLDAELSGMSSHLDQMLKSNHVETRRRAADVVAMFASINFGTKSGTFNYYIDAWVRTLIFDQDPWVREHGARALKGYIERPDFLLAAYEMSLSTGFIEGWDSSEIATIVRREKVESFIHLMREFDGNERRTADFIMGIVVPGLQFAQLGMSEHLFELWEPYRHLRTSSWTYAFHIAWTVIFPTYDWNFSVGLGIHREPGVLGVPRSFLGMSMEEIYRIRAEEAEKRQQPGAGVFVLPVWRD